MRALNTARGTSPEISVVVVTYQSKGIIADCLDALVEAIGWEFSAEIILVDSASNDGTVNHVQRTHPCVQVIPMSENRGFAAGVNAGVARARGEYVLLLNPDCLVNRDALARLCDYLRGKPGVAAVGPDIRNADGRLQHAERLLPSVRGEFVRCFERLARPLGVLNWKRRRESRNAHPEWISGACMLIRRAVIQDKAPFDEGFFLYFEETDWCREVRRRNLDVHHVSSAVVLHEGGASARCSGEKLVNGQIDEHFRRSRRRYFKKNHGLLAMGLVEWMHLTRRLLDRTRESSLCVGRVA